MLKERQKSLYNLLNSDTSKWFSQKEICDAISEYKYNDRKNSSDKCSAILQDKMTINESQEFEKIIVSKNYMFKIATIEDYKKERNFHIRKLKSQVKMIKDMDFKYKLNLQGVMDDTSGEVEKFIETFC